MKFFLKLLISVLGLCGIVFAGQDRMERFIEKQIKSYNDNRSPIEIGPESFKLTFQTPHNYSMLVLFAMPQNSATESYLTVMQEYLNWIQWDFESAKFTENPLFFAEMDAYQTLGFWRNWGWEPPMVALIKPSAEKDTFDHRKLNFFKIRDFSAPADLRQYILAELGINIPPSPDYSKYIIGTVFICAVSLLAINEKFQAMFWKVWTNSHIWLFICNAIFFYSISGQVFNSINTPPWNHQDEHGNVMWLYPSLRQQFGSEGYIMSGFFVAIGTAISVLLRKSGKGEMGRMWGYFAITAIVIGMMMVENFFNQKMRR